MTRGRRLAGAVVALAVLLVAAPAAAAEVLAVGWWTRSPSQQAPEDGFAVATAPDGDVTLAAVLLDLGPNGVSLATLAAVETGGLGQAGASLQVCPTSDQWAPEAGGDMADAPEPACDQATVPFERDAASSTWEADVTSLLAERTGTAALMIVPGPAPEGSMSAPLFDVRFAAPTLEAFERPDESGSSGSGFSSNGSSSSPATGSTSDSESAEPRPGGASGSSSDTLTSSPPPDLSPREDTATPAPAGRDEGSLPQTGVPTDDAVGADEDASGSDVASPPLVPSAATDGEGAPWGQALFFVVLSAVVATATAFASRWMRINRPA